MTRRSLLYKRYAEPIRLNECHILLPCLTWPTELIKRGILGSLMINNTLHTRVTVLQIDSGPFTSYAKVYTYLYLFSIDL